MAENRNRWRSNGTFGSIKVGEPDQLSNYQLLKKDSAVRSYCTYRRCILQNINDLKRSIVVHESINLLFIHLMIMNMNETRGQFCNG
jgi:hypothetical protein